MKGGRSIQVVADGDGAAVRKRAAALARELSLPSGAYGEASSSRLVLGVGVDAVELREASARSGRGVRVDFRSIDMRRGRGNFSRRQPLGRAIGRKNRTVVDGTAGLGHDAALLACMGYEVLAVERSPVVAALLRDGVQRAMDDARLAKALGGRLRVVVGDCRDVIADMKERPDVIYLDPMFPPKRKRGALAKKSVRLLREVVGDDEDAGELLEAAIASVGDRVVVKRPAHGEALGGRPELSVGGKLVKYDVYLACTGGGVAGGCSGAVDRAAMEEA